LRSDAATPHISIGDLTIHDVTTAEAHEIIDRWLASPDRVRLACTPNVDYVIRAGRNATFRDAIEACDLRLPDGMWIVYASRIAGRPLRGSVTGRLLLPHYAAACAAAGGSIALVGAGPGVAAAAAQRLQAASHGLRVVAAISPPMGFIVGSPEDDAIVAELVRVAPAMIFVALGAPKQEVWMAQHRDQLGPAVVIGVGQAFDVVAGAVREAPPWMTRIGMEWAFRLAQQPRRLARRYLIDDPWILWWAIRTRIGSLIAQRRST
jgi:N-acetylglucosaminyldiphosphoundecaprenol N-acetyl-beta-D-mannosaminyltransferase